MPPSQRTASALHPELTRYVDFFFTALQEQTSKGPSDLARLKVLGGVYVEAPENATATYFGRPVPITHHLRVANRPIRKTGPASFSVAGVELTPGQYTETDVVYLHELGDAVADDGPTLSRILANVENGPAWATAIAGASDRGTFFNRNVSAIDRVPDGAPSNDATALRALLYRHFTYDDEGNYFAKWQGAGRAYPTNLTDAYKTKALREMVLTAGEVYCLGVIPARLVDATAEELAMREFLVHISRSEPAEEAGGADQLELVPLYSVARESRAAGQPGFHQFCFFHSMAGSGVAIPDTAAVALTSGLTGLLSIMPRRAQMQTYAESAADPQYFFQGTGADLKIRLLGVIRPGAALQGLPAGVEAHDIVGGERTPAEGPAEPSNIRYFLCPVDKIVELAAHADVERLEEVKPVYAQVSQAVTDLKVEDLRTRLRGLPTVAVGDGHGTLVGVIDTGIDGTHPAFAGRIQAVWDQTLPRQNPPVGIPGGNFGRVLTGADIATHSLDTAGHGTHCAGIAAGAASPPDYTEGGVAPRARLLVVRATADGTFTNANIIAGARWIFQQAAAAAQPCVINMSFGSGGEDHDGTSLMGQQLRALIRTGANWRAGRILVAASGNARGRGVHVHKDALPVPTRTPDETAGRVRFRRENHPEATAEFRIFVRRGVVGNLPFLFFGTPTDPAVTRCNMAIRVELEPGGGAAAWPGWLAQQPDSNFRTRRIANTTVRLANGRRAPLGVRQSRPVLILSSRLPGLPIDTGVWKVTIFNDGASAIDVHGYSPFSAGTSLLFFRDSTEKFMVESPADTEGIIAVGSTVNRASWPRQDGETVRNERETFDNTGAATGAVQEVRGAISGFSCAGPVRRVNRPLDCVAPGGGIFSARSAQIAGVAPNDIVNAKTMVNSGTSMACPFVVGLAAHLLEQKPDMTYPEFQARLVVASTMPPGGNAEDFGPGVIDASRLPFP